MIRCSGNENLKQLYREIAGEYRAATKIEQNLSSVNRPENLPTQSPYEDKCFGRPLTSSWITWARAWSCENQNILKPRNSTQKSVTLTETVTNSLESTTSVPRQLLNHDRLAHQVPVLAQKIQSECSRKTQSQRELKNHQKRIVNAIYSATMLERVCVKRKQEFGDRKQYN